MKGASEKGSVIKKHHWESPLLSNPWLDKGDFFTDSGCKWLHSIFITSHDNFFGIGVEAVPPPMMPIFGYKCHLPWKRHFGQNSLKRFTVSIPQSLSQTSFLSDAIIDRLSTPKEDKCRVMTGTQLKHYHPFAWPLSVLMSIMQISSELELFWWEEICHLSYSLTCVSATNSII